MSTGKILDVSQFGAIQQIPELRQLALDGLVRMFDEQKKLFCHRRRLEGDRLINEGTSLRYTAMTLLGVQRCQRMGVSAVFPVKAIVGNMLEHLDDVAGVGDLGMMLWLCAAVWPERLAEIGAHFRTYTVLDRFRDAQEGKTTELAWLLAGLSHANLAGPDSLPGSMDVAARVYRMLRKNQGPSGIFGHQARGASLTGMVRGRIGSFADQVYPIYAFTQFARAYNAGEALPAATQCAQAICAAQGSRGQWWWHYDAESGKCVERYPVYSVHQDGMAPMALLALSEAANIDFDGPVYKGLQWITGDNELSEDLRDSHE